MKIDNFLNPNDMIGDVCTTWHFRLNKLNGVWNSLDVHLKILLVSCCVLTSIDYCIALHANMNGLQMKHLCKLIKASDRFTYGLRKTERITAFMKHCCFLPVECMILMGYAILTSEERNRF